MKSVKASNFFAILHTQFSV